VLKLSIRSLVRLRKGEVMTDVDVLKLLERRIVEVGSVKKFAETHNLSPQFVGDVRKRRRGLSTSILEALGLVAMIHYRARQ
jgi:hypothetical protein